MTRSFRSATKVSTAKTTVVNGLQIGLGFAGINALRAVEGRFGLDGIMARLPGGMIGRVLEYVLKYVNTGLAAGIASKIGKRGFGERVRAGGFANLGVSLLGDVAGMLGGPGAMVSSYLHGVGDYNLAAGGTVMNPYPAMGNYNLAAGGQAMQSVSGSEVYPDLDSIYG